MANAGTVGKPSVARTTRPYRSVPLVAPPVGIVPRRRLPPGGSLVPPLRNAAAAAAARRRRHLSTSHPLLNTTHFLDPAFVAAIAVAACPAPWAHSQHFGIPKGEYNNSQRVIQLTTQRIFANSATTPGAIRSHVRAFYNITYVFLMLVAQPTIYAQCSTAL